MSVVLPDLPYDKRALGPHISEETLNYHYGKHHKAYVDKLNGQIPGTEWEKASLEEIVKFSRGGVFNNSAQVWNHTFYWNCLSPKGGALRPGLWHQRLKSILNLLKSSKRGLRLRLWLNLVPAGPGWLKKGRN